MISDNIRKLAQSDKYQTIFSRSKDINGICLFKNNIDFSYAQILFLNWLNIYSSLYTDLAMGEEYISEEVINDDIRTDAYLIYRNKVKNKKDNKPTKKNKKQRQPAPGIPKIIFTSKRK